MTWVKFNSQATNANPKYIYTIKKTLFKVTSFSLSKLLVAAIAEGGQEGKLQGLLMGLALSNSSNGMEWSAINGEKRKLLHFLHWRSAAFVYRLCCVFLLICLFFYLWEKEFIYENNKEWAVFESNKFLLTFMSTNLKFSILVCSSRFFYIVKKKYLKFFLNLIWIVSFIFELLKAWKIFFYLIN